VTPGSNLALDIPATRRQRVITDAAETAKKRLERRFFPADHRLPGLL
jgi:hypothetical protein